MKENPLSSLVGVEAGSPATSCQTRRVSVGVAGPGIRESSAWIPKGTRAGALDRDFLEHGVGARLSVGFGHPRRAAAGRAKGGLGTWEGGVGQAPAFSGTPGTSLVEWEPGVGADSKGLRARGGIPWGSPFSWAPRFPGRHEGLALLRVQGS